MSENIPVLSKQTSKDQNRSENGSPISMPAVPKSVSHKVDLPFCSLVMAELKFVTRDNPPLTDLERGLYFFCILQFSSLLEKQYYC